MTEARSPELDKVVEADDSDLKELFVQYIGNKLQPETDEITVEMAVQVLAEEFPEFLLAVAEENFVRGYEQAVVDMDTK
jgi:hypothetical protein